MLAVEIELLTGRYTATKFNDRDAAEWPPHPARLFFALVAAWAGENPPDADERAALTWFERQGAPAIAHSDHEERAVVTHYVPDNDTTVASRDLSRLYGRIAQAEARLAKVTAGGSASDDPQVAKARRAVDRLIETAVADSQRVTAARRGGGLDVELLPDQRGRQGRAYPTVIPEDPRVCFVWSEAEPTAQQRAVLDGVLARVARLGHSSSMVACRIVDGPESAATVPDPQGGEVIRVASPGLLDRLEIEFARHQASEPRVLPARMTRYGAAVRTSPPPAPLLGERWLVLARLGARAPHVARALDVARAVRSALLSHADEPIPEILSGHQPGAPGQETPPSTRPHLAVVPLPWVGGRNYSDGTLMGVALVLPREAADAERTTVLRALGRWIGASEERVMEVQLGRSGVLLLELMDEPGSRYTLSPQRWCRQARMWASATPVVLDRFPGDLRDRRPDRRAAAEAKAAEVIGRACEYAGLPSPATVEVRVDSALRGAPPLSAFPPYRPKANGPVRLGVHTRLVFDEPVAGPVLIGAGRYLGYGLCQPIALEKENRR